MHIQKYDRSTRYPSSLSPDERLLRDDELEFVVGGLERPVNLPRDLERPARLLSPSDAAEG